MKKVNFYNCGFIDGFENKSNSNHTHIEDYQEGFKDGMKRYNKLTEGKNFCC